MLGLAGAAGGGNLGNLFITLSADAMGMVKGMKEAEIAVTTGSARILAAAKAMSIGVTASLAVIGTAGVVEYGKFQKAMTAATAIMGDVSEELQRRMEMTARTIATQSTSSAKELADAYYFLASAGLTAEQSIAALHSVDKFAIAGQFNLSQATSLLADAQSSLGLKVADATKNMENMNRVADVLTKANIIANASVEQFSVALTREAGAAMKSFKIDVEEGVAVLAAMADQGIKAEHAGMSFSRMVRLVSSEAVQNAETYREMGVAIFDTSGKMRNMADIIGDLEKALLGLSAEEKVAALEALGFRAQIQGVILPMLGTSQKIREYEAALRSAGGVTQDVADKQIQNLFDQLTITWHRFEDILITIGEKLTPVLMVFNTALQNSIGTAEQFNSECASWANNIAPAFVAAIGVVGDALWGWKVIIKSLQLAFSWLFEKAGEGFAFILQKISTVVAGILKVFNKLQAEMLKLPGAASALGGGINTAPIANSLRGIEQEMSNSAKNWEGIVAQNQQELDELVAAGSFSDRFIAKFEKVSEASSRESKKVVSDVKNAVDSVNNEAGRVSDAQATSTINQMYGETFGSSGYTGNSTMMTGPGMGDPMTQQMQQYQVQQEAAEENLATMQELGDAEVELTIETEARRLAIVEEYENRINQLKMAQTQLALESASNMFDSLAQISEAYAGKQSDAYKAMFAVSKAFAIAEATVKIAQGIANAASMSWPANLVAMASVAAATASIVSSIQSVQLEFGGGKAAGGSVSGGKAYLVGEKGPEMFSPGGNGSITPNEMLGGSVKVVINNYTDAKAEVRESGDGRDKTIEVIIAQTKNAIAADIKEGRGEINKSIQSSFGLKRNGR